MIKLLLVIHSLKGGGSERVVINLLKGLNRKEFSITLVLYVDSLMHGHFQQL